MDADRPALTPRLPRWFVAALAAVPVCFLLLFYAWPLGTLLATVAGEGSRGGLGARRLLRIAWFTTWQAAASSAIALVAGMLPAYLIARWRLRSGRLLAAVVTVPFLMPTIVVGAAFRALLPGSMLGTAGAIVIAHVFVNIAVVTRVVAPLWRRVPADLIAAARTLGASPWRATREITLPLLRSAMLAATGVVFVFTFTSFGIVQVLGGATRPTLEVEIARRATQLGDVRGAAVLAVLQLALLALIVLATVAARRGLAAAWGGGDRMTGLAAGDARERLPSGRGGRRRRIALRSLSALCIAVMAAPIIALAAASFRVGERTTLAAWRRLGDREIRPGVSLGIDPLASIAVSLRYAVLATLVSVAVGGLAAFAIHAARRRGRLLDAGLMLPLGTSAVTIGFGMLITFDQAPFDWRAEPWLIPLGHALVGAPFVTRAVLPVLRAMPRGWAGAAATLGASPLRAWRELDLAVARRPLVVGAGIAAAISLGEFGATTFLTRSGRETVPIAISRLLARTGDLPRAQGFAMATLLALVAGAVIAIAEVGDARRS